MDSDFRPAQPPAKSLPSATDAPDAATPTPDKEVTPTAEAAQDADDSLVKPVDLGQMPASAPARKPGNDWRQKLKVRWPPSRKEYIVLAVVIVIALGAGLAVSHHRSKPLAVVKPVIVKPKPPPKPTTVASTLSGLQVDPTLNNLPVTGVMIENSTDARPQSGLGQAGVVFEAVAEGGVTRFLALFQDTSPSNVGPIRSARPYYVQWDLGFDAAYAHVGGSPDALSDIKSWGVHDLDEFANGGSYHRISTREAPHNVYTAISTLNQLEITKGYLHSTFTGFARKTAAPVKQPTAGSINLTLSGSLYNAHYDYAVATNSYNRSEGGAPQLDANTNTQISPAVVIAMVVPESRGALDASGAYYSDYNVIGSGPVYVFQDGSVTTGSWTKTDNNSQLSFADASGQPIKLNPGQTWLTAVTSASDVSYTP